MKDNIAEKLGMFQTVQAYLIKEADETVAVAIVAIYKIQLDNHVKEIYDLSVL